MLRRLSVVVAAASLAVACGVDADVAGDGDGGLVAVLGRLPAVEDADRSVTVNLHDRAREAAGLEAPAGGGQEAFDEYRSTLTIDGEAGLFLAPAQLTGIRWRSADEWRAELGFDLSDVDADALVGLAPDHVEVVTGVDAGAVDEAVRADPVWSEHLEEPEHDGTRYYAWGEDGAIDVERISAARPLGESTRMVVEDGAVAWVRSTAVAEGTIDAWHGEAETLADNEALVALASALDAEGAHAAHLSTEVRGFEASAAVEPVDASLALPRYEAFATAVALPEPGAPALVVALVYGDEAAAEAAVPALERTAAEGTSVLGDRWSELLGPADVRADGRVVVGVFPTDQGDLWHQLPATRDTLLVWA